jgi:anti-sigma regulatory factor (Ser/Thr protein kinase)
MPAATCSTSRLELAAVPNAVRWARRHGAAVLEDWHLTTTQVETAQLLISELVTNAVKYAVAPDAIGSYVGLVAVRRVVLTLRRSEDRLLIEVFDADEHLPVLTQAEPDAEGGRGLTLVDMLSEEWGSFIPPTGGKIVWCELALTA